MVYAVTQDQSARVEDRHSHIGIRLGYWVDGQWEYLEAHGWNEVGFNFYSACENQDRAMLLRRGLARFNGTIVWRTINTDDAVAGNAGLA